jgi:hypothetical protein
MKMNAVSFGKITIVDPQTTSALAKELRAFSRRDKYTETPVLNAIRGRRIEASGNDDTGLVKESFSPDGPHNYGHATGVFPSFSQWNHAGLFPLRDGYGALVTNDRAHVQDLTTGSDAPHKYDDLNSLLFTFHQDPEGFSDPAAVVSKFVDRERGLTYKIDRRNPGQSGPVVQLDLKA